MKICKPAKWIMQSKKLDPIYEDLSYAPQALADRYHDYTGFINTVSTIQTCQPYGCGTVNELWSVSKCRLTLVPTESRTPAKNVLEIFSLLLFLPFPEEIELDHIIKKRRNYNSSNWNQ